MTTPPTYRPLIHGTAFATTCVALLPIVVGALVTTMGAGMAFRDWPASDGWFMLTYPWLADFARGAMHKFVEHGHRLAGVVIGLTSIAMAIVAWSCERRLWVKLLATGVLGCVVVQGLLGGGRVLADDARMAMLHGNFAAVVFCLMAGLTLVTSKRWIAAAESTGGGTEVKKATQPPTGVPAAATLKVLAVATPIVVYGQYILGGFQRHLHTMLHEHVAGATVAAVFVLATAVAAIWSGLSWLRGPAYCLLLLLFAQIGLGMGAWLTKLGFPPLGYVAVQGTSTQLIVRSAHTVVGMLLLATSLVLVLRLSRLLWAQPVVQRKPNAAALPIRSFTTEGGAG